MTSFYHDGNRQLQEKFDTTRVAGLLEERTVHDVIDEGDKAFMEARDMFFIATADEEGRTNCSYKGGEPGFVRVIDEHTIAFPNYDGNGMYLSMGNLLKNPHVGLLFIDFEQQNRMRLNGIASIDEHDPLIADYPEAQFIVRVRATEIFPNCPRYIHHYQLVERSRYVPKEACETPIPDWKRGVAQFDAGLLPKDDPARLEAQR